MMEQTLLAIAWTLFTVLLVVVIILLVFAAEHRRHILRERRRAKRLWLAEEWGDEYLRLHKRHPSDYKAHLNGEFRHLEELRRRGDLPPARKQSADVTIGGVLDTDLSDELTTMLSEHDARMAASRPKSEEQVFR